MTTTCCQPTGLEDLQLNTVADLISILSSNAQVGAALASNPQIVSLIEYLLENDPGVIAALLAFLESSTGATGLVYQIENNSSVQAAIAALIPGSNINVQTFNYTGSPQTYHPTANIIYAIIEVIGAGGGGGSCLTGSASYASVGSGGNGGAYCKKSLLSSLLSGPNTIIIGEGGIHDASGTLSSFEYNGSTFLTAHGGNSGSTSPESNSTYPVAIVESANAGAIATGGDDNRSGGIGGIGYFHTQSGVLNGAGGCGGACGNGAGGVSGPNYIGNSNSQNGNNGVSPGTGGSGSMNVGTIGTYSGGTGANGQVIITEIIA